MGIGSLADIGPANARKTAKKIREQARDGINPKLHRKQVSASARSAPLFKDFATMICDQVVIGLKGDNGKVKWHRCINVYSEPLHKIPVNQISVDDVMRTLLPTWRTKPVAARETRSHLQHVFGAAKAWGTSTAARSIRRPGRITQGTCSPSNRRRVRWAASISPCPMTRCRTLWSTCAR
jgi:hypothetical protein